MKKSNQIILLLFVLSFYKTLAQEKVKFDKKSFKFNAIQYPKMPCLDDALTQTTYFNIAEGTPIAEKNLKRDFFKIDGYIKEPENGDMKINITIPVVTSKTTKNDSTFYLGYDIDVDVKCNGSVIYSKKYPYIGNVKYGRKLSKIELMSGMTEVELRNEFGDEIEESINYTMSKIETQLNNILGYNSYWEKATFIFLSSKEHSEYAKFKEFEGEISDQMKSVNLENGLDSKRLFSHLAYLESLLSKYPEAEENRKIRFLAAYNLAAVYFLLENTAQTTKFAELVVKNNFRTAWGSELLDKLPLAYFETRKTRAHNFRFANLKKLGYELKELAKQEAEDTRAAFFERIQNEEQDKQKAKEDRLKGWQITLLKRAELLDSSAKQQNGEILLKLLEGLGGTQILKGISKVHMLSRLNYEDSNVPIYDEKWCNTLSNYLLKRKSPEYFYVIANQEEAWQHNDKRLGEKWVFQNSADYQNISQNLDPLYLLGSINLNNWNKYELKDDAFIDGQPCYKLEYLEKTLSTNNRLLPKTDNVLYISKDKYRLLATEKTEFEEGKKLSFEKKIFQDYRELISLNSGAIPHKILYQIEDYYGDTIFEELVEKVEINPTFANRIFVKEVYLGGFK